MNLPETVWDRIGSGIACIFGCLVAFAVLWATHYLWLTESVMEKAFRGIVLELAIGVALLSALGLTSSPMSEWS